MCQSKLLYRIIVLAALLIGVAHAQPITLVVPFAVGGNANTLSRIVQQTLSENMNRDIVVENKVGASGEIAASYVAKHEKGTMLLMASVSLATNNITPNSLYDLNRDLQPIFYFGHTPLILVASSQSAIYSIDDIKHSKKIISYGSAGVGTSSHLSGAELSKRLNKDLTHVPYKGVGQVVPDLISGNLDVSFMFGATIIPYIQTNQVRPIAVVSEYRLSSLPQVPTFKELGYKNFGFDTWFILLANKNASSQELTEIRKILQQTLSTPITAQPYRNIGLEYNVQDFDKSSVILKKEIERYKHFYQLYPELK